MDDAYYLFNTGHNHMSYKLFGSHAEVRDGQEGFRFAVWAPHANYVSVAGDFNEWRSEDFPLEKVRSTGVWEGFVPSAAEGQCYKYYVVGQDGKGRFKADPYARKTELRPNDASVLYIDKEFTWTDEAYLESRKNRDVASAPINIYEVHISSWRRKDDGSYYTYEELAVLLADYVEKMGYTHIELMPITEYPFDGSWGYQVTGYFSPTARHGDKAGFQYFMNHMHEKGISVIMDWVPAHFPRDAFGLAFFDGQACYEYADSRLGEHADWGTLVFDYSKAEVRSFLASSAVYWLDEFHVDGLRVDAVSAMIYRNYGRTVYLPNQYGGTENLEAVSFLRDLNDLVHEQYPGALMIAEESTAWPKITHASSEGGMGFDMKWDMGWMHDTLAYFSLDYLWRKHHHNEITFSMLYNFHERFLLALSHDEVVHGKSSLMNKMPGDFWRKFASMRELFLYQMGHPGGKLNFMGSEIGQFIEWRYYEQLEWFLLDYDMHNKLHEFVRTLNHLYLEIPAFWEDDTTWEGFNWLNADDATNSVYSWVRRDKRGGCLIFIINMTPAPVNNYKFPAPARGTYEIILNSDDKRWGGSDYEVLIPRGQIEIAPGNERFGDALYSWDPDVEIRPEAEVEAEVETVPIAGQVAVPEAGQTVIDMAGPPAEQVSGQETAKPSEFTGSATGAKISSRDIANHGYRQSLRLNLPPLGGLILQLAARDESPEPPEPWPDPEMPIPDDWSPPKRP